MTVCLVLKVYLLLMEHIAMQEWRLGSTHFNLGTGWPAVLLTRK